MTRLIPKTEYLCHGIGCPNHKDCARYTEAEGALDHLYWRGTCDDKKGGWPMFVKVAKQEQPA